MIVNYLIFPKIEPIIFNIGPVSFYWYGFMYFIAFLFSSWFLYRRANEFNSFWTKKEIENLLFLCFLGILLGGRVGYVIFYAWDFFSEDVLFLFRIWEGGMSFHGGLIGVVIALFYFSYFNYTRHTFFQVSDFIVPVVPFGLGIGRLGNFINGELWGRVTDAIPWAVLFPSARDQDILTALTNPKWYSLFEQYGMLPRHPSQLYEMFLEGILLFVIFNYLPKRLYLPGTISGLFLLFYGIVRILAECFRQPDPHLGLFKELFSMGQILSFPMVIIGIVLIILSYYQYIK
ncbi:prolipoprotein diacylglyceryl transferase [Blochmannia endosymbiont of Colobopsis nipponica]|uniref:prolipoprotein diacylglyceryl transferase n=1 Tax=Blochmannia endosymbiont of Colobopsis nipponica TaxID=2681987 RepID=UPI00177D4A19|nr:prolipoprotein diacylglyceryl transferase [Blochmannia endosymbiont of Colobopsis nipponica]QOI11165.1 prolipoprotein diacylglyceryl transferase [Blochmannia endosymbiont of Colobopsis nipponica]